jgi:hypothetical protein
MGRLLVWGYLIEPTARPCPPGDTGGVTEEGLDGEFVRVRTCWHRALG